VKNSRKTYYMFSVFPEQVKDFPSRPFAQTGSDAHAVSYPLVTGGAFPGRKTRPRRGADHTPPSNAEVKNEYSPYFTRKSLRSGVDSGAVRGESVLMGGLKGSYWWKTV
jgi:hypothetical protein